MREGWRQLLGGLVLAWCVAGGIAGFLEARRRPLDALPALDEQFQAFAPLLPPTGEISFLEPLRGAGTPEMVRLHYAAQYALTPRVVVARVGLEFLIVAQGVAEDGDPRLEGYTRLATTPSGHRLFRRLP